MNGVKTEWYEYIDDRDMQSRRSYESMIGHCNCCGAFFSSKACGNRTVFTWGGYHPTDGNVKVVTDEFIAWNNAVGWSCDCSMDHFSWLRSKNALDKALAMSEGLFNAMKEIG